LNRSPPDLCLLSSLDYRLEPPMPSWDSDHIGLEWGWGAQSRH
jgi:hypothetical protein